LVKKQKKTRFDCSELLGIVVEEFGLPKFQLSLPNFSLIFQAKTTACTAGKYFKAVGRS
jgi:hypothetical protein